MESKIRNTGTAKTYLKVSTRNIIIGLFRRFPILSNEAIFRIVVIVFMLPLIILINKGKGECTCEDQIEDQRLASATFKQDKQVQIYLKTRDNLVMCEARRQQLLKKLEQEKKLKNLTLWIIPNIYR